jgi:hypothetical protein
MKDVLMALAFLAAAHQQTAVAERVEQSREWTESFEVSAALPSLHISNIWGDVRVRTGKEGVIILSLSEQRSAPSQKLFDRSLEILKLDTRADSNGLSVVVGQRDKYWQRHDPCSGCQVTYQFDVSVPPGTAIDVSTVNDGRIDVAGVAGQVIASNVNGPIVITGLQNCATLENVNGAVELGFTRAPTEDCVIETINGDITLVMPGETGLNVAMDLFNGHLVSEFPVDPLAIPARVEHSQRDGRNHYQIVQAAGVQLAGGGPTFSISSLNGEIHIKKSQ